MCTPQFPSCLWNSSIAAMPFLACRLISRCHCTSIQPGNNSPSINYARGHTKHARGSIFYTFFYPVYCHVMSSRSSRQLHEQRLHLRVVRRTQSCSKKTSEQTSAGTLKMISHHICCKSGVVKGGGKKEEKGRINPNVPVSGSQPGAASKPAVPQPGFLPLLMSFMTFGFAYSVGLRNPTGLLPASRRFSLIRVIMAAKTGAEAVKMKKENMSATMVIIHLGKNWAVPDGCLYQVLHQTYQKFHTTA